MEADHDAVPLSFRSGADNTAHQRNQSGDYQNPANSKLHGVFCVLVQVTFRDAPKQRPRKIRQHGREAGPGESGHGV
jgi:hypothetical protein